MLSSRQRMRFGKSPGILLLILIGGCSAPREARLVANPDASGKIPAIKIAVEHKDLAATKQMVKDLDSDDPAVRFYAIEGLERLTGQTFDYHYYADEEQRKPAISRWNQWLAEQKE